MTAAVFIHNAVLNSAAASGAKCYTYNKNTTTPKTVYTNVGLTTAAANPVVSDADGKIKFYFDDTTNFTFVVKTSDGATTLLEADYTASGKTLIITYADIGNWDALQEAFASLDPDLVDAVTIVSNIDAEVVIVADAIADVETVADNITDVQTVAQELYYFVRPEQRLARGDGVKGYSGVATSGDQTFTDSGASWTSADIGKVIVIKAAGAAVYKANSATIDAGGSSYVVGDLLTVSGGTSRTPTVFRVDAVSGGAVTAVSVRCRGYYSALPSNPVSTTGGSGTGCTLTLTTETGYGAHRTTIALINSPTSIELAAAPTTSVASNARYTYGTDDTTALQATLNALGFMGAMALKAGKVYCYSNLTLPTNMASGVYYSNRNGVICPDGIAELACIGGGDDDYGIAPDRWLTANANKAYAGSPWMFSNIVFDALGQVERNVVHKSYMTIYTNCWFRGGLIADLEATRQNQDGSDGSAGYNADNAIINCRFDGEAIYQFRSIGDTTGLIDSTTDGDIVGTTFTGQANADYGIYFGNFGGWMAQRNRFYSHRIAGAYIYVVARGGQVAANNFEGGNETYQTVPGLIVGSVGGYPDAVIGPGNQHYSDVFVDFAADTTNEIVHVRGDHFFTKIDGDPDAQVVHNNNRSQKTLALEGCDFYADPPYRRYSGNTAGVIVAHGITVALASGNAKRIAHLLDDPDNNAGPQLRRVRRGRSTVGTIISDDAFFGENASGTLVQYAGIRTQIATATAGAEDGVLFFQNIIGGSFDNRFKMGSGFFGTSLTDPGTENFNALTGYYVNNSKVIGTRKTGWTPDTGTAKRTANATYSGTAEVAYTQATIQTLMDAVRDLSQTVKALKDDLHATAGHGLIGT